MDECDFIGCSNWATGERDVGAYRLGYCREHGQTLPVDMTEAQARNWLNGQPISAAPSTDDALSKVLGLLERIADQIAELDARLSAFEGAETAGGIPDWARQDYFCGER